MLKRLPGSTVLEIVTAMVIIIVVIGLGLMVIINVNRGSLSITRIRAIAVLQQKMVEINTKKNFDDSDYIDGDFKITLRVKQSPMNPDMYRVELAAYSLDNQQLVSFKSDILDDR